MELRQLRYFATLAEELHFGHAASREHIVQSALSQQIKRLERELGVPLLERSTHHVRLTPSGEVFLVDTRQILDHVERAKKAARCVTESGSVLRIAVGDASFDSMRQVLEAIQHAHPGIEIHRIETGVPEQCRMLADGRLDVGFGCAIGVPPGVASEMLRLDPMGVLIASTHPLSCVDSIPVSRLASETLLMFEDFRAPELNEFVLGLCLSAGFTPRPYRGTVQSVRCAADVVSEGRCILCVPRSCGVVSPSTHWVSLTAPVARYPWSLLWRADNQSEPVRFVRECARVVSGRLRWMCADSAADISERAGSYTGRLPVNR